MQSTFRVVGILGRIQTQPALNTLFNLMHLLDSLGQKYIVETQIAAHLPEKTPQYERQDIAMHCDLAIVIGGDGSLLHAAQAVIHQGIPLLGINRGKLGFLNEINPSDLHKIQAILKGEYRTEERFLLEATIIQEKNILATLTAINEIALIPAIHSRMTQFSIHIDDHFVCNQHADGVIVATPTGSTAYALSGGGPILHPALDAIAIVPMFPHTLSMRPLVISSHSQIHIQVVPHADAIPYLSADGMPGVEIPNHSLIHIKKNKQKLKLIHALDYDYYASLRSKLHWGKLLQNQEMN